MGTPIDADRGRRGRPARLLSALALLLIVLLVALAPIPAFLVEPGPPISLADTLVVDGQPAGEVLEGDVLVTTIAVTGASTADLVRSWFSPSLAVVAESALIPPGMDVDTYVEAQQTVFDDAVEGAGAAVADLQGLDAVSLTFTRDDVGGPSAGLAAALAAVDVLDPADVLDGRSVAVTGEIEADGDVVGVGSVDMKVRAAIAADADVFVVPAGQASVASDVAGEALKVIAVETLAEAVQGLGG